MKAIFSRRSKLVAWLDEYSSIIFDLNTRPIAHVALGAVYTYDSHHLGYFDKGFFRDLGGHAVAFLHERTGGPITAIPSMVRLPPVAPWAPAPPSPPAAPAMPIAGYTWSMLDWDDFMKPAQLRQTSKSDPGAALIAAQERA